MLKQKVLVIDERQQDCHLYRSILVTDEDPTLEALTSTDTAEQALELAAEALEKGQAYPLAILDFRLSKGMDGMSAARELRRLDDRIIIIFITAHSDFSANDIDAEFGHDVMLLKKPISADELTLLTRNSLQQWLHNQDQHSLSSRVAKQADINNNERDGVAKKMLAELSQALSIVEQNMNVIRQEDEKIQHLHAQLQQALGDQYPSSEAMGDVQESLQQALFNYRKYCASPELLTAVVRLRKLQKSLQL